jgi:hypothetical protein
LPEASALRQVVELNFGGIVTQIEKKPGKKNGLGSTKRQFVSDSSEYWPFRL